MQSICMDSGEILCFHTICFLFFLSVWSFVTTICNIEIAVNSWHMKLIIFFFIFTVFLSFSCTKYLRISDAYIYPKKLTVLGRSAATSSSITSLTTFFSSVVVVSLIFELCSFSLGFFYSSSRSIASTQATFFPNISVAQTQRSFLLPSEIKLLSLSKWSHQHTRQGVWSRQKHFSYDGDIVYQSLGWCVQRLCFMGVQTCELKFTWWKYGRG